MRNYLLLLLLLCLEGVVVAQSQREFTIKGRVINSTTRKGVAFASVVVEGQYTKGAAADFEGYFTIKGVKPGIYRLEASHIQYEAGLSDEYRINATTPLIEIELEASPYGLDSIVIRPNKFKRVVESPVSLRRIGAKEIEKSPGANRDVSRIVQSYPGVAYSPAGYRNDLIVRGGSPSENRFYIDGIEIPNINHFATQGASGGPVSLLNADLIRSIDFYTGAFPASQSGALSSMLDIKLRDGDNEDHTFKATLGAAEISLSGNGPVTPKTTYIFSVRQSYLQFLFDALGLPFLPNFIDGQFKLKTNIAKGKELTVLGLAGFDKFTLNDDVESDINRYLVGVLPYSNQETYTVGASYRRYRDNRSHTISLSHSYFNNRSTKYFENDDSVEDNLNLKLRSVESKTTLTQDNRHYRDNWTYRYGADNYYARATFDSFSRTYVQGAPVVNDYDTKVGVWGWGLFASATYKNPSSRIKGSAGLRVDANDFSKRSSQFWRQLSPRFSLSYDLKSGFALNASSGIYFQMPPYTALAYRTADGLAVNESMGYMNVISSAMGLDWSRDNRLKLSVEGFYKKYGEIPLSVENGIPLTGLGDDYGVVGNEWLTQRAQGRAYGVEFMARMLYEDKFSGVCSITIFNSEYRSSADQPYVPSAWDSGYIVNLSGTYDFASNWSIGAKISATGGAPYTPYDLVLSSYVDAWSAAGRPYLDYDRYNSLREDSYAQLDIRVDKSFYFTNWMLGLYLDIQNITSSEFRQADIYVSTGEIINPQAPPSEQRYEMKPIENVSGTLLPTIGIMVEF